MSNIAAISILKLMLDNFGIVILLDQKIFY